jgi:hypothetical protein
MSSAHCIRGHDLSILGRGKNGHCIACRRADHRKRVDSGAKAAAAARYKARTGQTYSTASRSRNFDRYRQLERRRLLMKEYGIALEDYEGILSAQGGRCAICRAAPGERGGKNMALAVDHCHRTGRIRGLLCYRCNSAIGLVSEDVGILARCIEYIKAAE